MLLTFAYWAGLVLAALTAATFAWAVCYSAVCRLAKKDSVQISDWHGVCAIVCWVLTTVIGKAFIPVGWPSVAGFVGTIAGFCALTCYMDDFLVDGLSPKDRRK